MALSAEHEKTLNHCWYLAVAVLVVVLLLLLNAYFSQDGNLYISGKPAKSGFSGLANYNQGSSLALAGTENSGLGLGFRSRRNKKLGYEPPVFWNAGDLAADPSTVAEFMNVSTVGDDSNPVIARRRINSGLVNNDEGFQTKNLDTIRPY